jgi:hypothetical protein
MRRNVWLAAPLALLLLGAWLSSLAEAPRPTRVQARVSFPGSLRAPEYERMQARQTLVVPAVAVAAAATPPIAGPPEPPAKRDPFLAALPARADDPVVVFEANALRHSRLGELFLQCALAKDPRTFEKIQRELGIDVLKDVDRVAFVGESVVVSGFFQRLDPEQLRKETGAWPERVGEAGVVWAESSAPTPGRFAAGTWRDQIVILSSDPAVVRLAIDQLEGRVAPPAIELPDDIAYGEAYGIIPGAALRRILHGEQELLADRLAAAARRVELHADAMQDIALVARFQGGDDASALSDLARAMGGVLAGARLHAQATGDGILADLLDQASVVSGTDSFSVQVALPIERVERWFAGCRR